MRILVAILLLALFFSGKDPNEDRQKSYAEDFRILVTSLKELDPMLYKIMDRQTFDARVKHVEERLLTAKSRNEALYIMQEFLYDLGDSHATIVSAYYDLGIERALPFKVLIIDDHLYIRKCPSDTTLTGAEIFSIDGVPAPVLLDSLRIFYPNDGARHITGFGLQALFNSLYGAFCHQADAYTINTSMGVRTMTAVQKEDPLYHSLISYDWKHYGHCEPGFSRQVTDSYGYFRFTEFKKEEEGHNIEDEFESLITELNSKQVKNLVLDLRYNSGGDPYLAGRMATHFTTEPFPLFGRLILTRTRKVTYASYMVRNFAYRFRLAGTRVFGDHREKVNYERGLRDYTPSQLHFDGTVYVLTSSMTGSAATMLCKYLQCLPNVRFVGSETNGATNYFCAHKHCELTLPNTNIYATFGMQLVELKIGSSDVEQPVGIVPPNIIHYSVQDMLQSADKEMEWVRNDIASRAH